MQISYYLSVPCTCFEQPIVFGFSLTSLYSDRPGIDDVGHGLTLMFWNKYAVGYANHDGADGYFISVDLLKGIEDVNSKRSSYSSKIQKVLGLN